MAWPRTFLIETFWSVERWIHPSLRSAASIETKPWIEASLRGRAVAVEIDFASGVESDLRHRICSCLFGWTGLVWAGPIKFLAGCAGALWRAAFATKKG